MRTLSLNLRTVLFSQETSEVAICFLTITHPSMPSPIRLSSDPTTRITTTPLVYGTVSRGNTYLYVGMQVTLPDEKDKAAPAAKLVISNIDLSVIPLIRSVSSPASVLIEWVLASAPDTVEFSMPALDILMADWDSETITFDMSMNAMAVEPYGFLSFDPATFPGLFS